MRLWRTGRLFRPARPACVKWARSPRTLFSHPANRARSLDLNGHTQNKLRSHHQRSLRTSRSRVVKRALLATLLTSAPTVHAIRPAAGGARACTRVELLLMSNCCWIEPLCHHCRSDCVSNSSLHSSSASRTVCERSITHDFHQSSHLRASPRLTAAQRRHRRSRMDPASRVAPSRCRGPSCGGDRVTRSCR